MASENNFGMVPKEKRPKDKNGRPIRGGLNICYLISDLSEKHGVHTVFKMGYTTNDYFRHYLYSTLFSAKGLFIHCVVNVYSPQLTHTEIKLATQGLENAINSKFHHINNLSNVHYDRIQGEYITYNPRIMNNMREAMKQLAQENHPLTQFIDIGKEIDLSFFREWDQNLADFYQAVPKVKFPDDEDEDYRVKFLPQIKDDEYNSGLYKFVVLYDDHTNRACFIVVPYNTSIMKHFRAAKSGGFNTYLNELGVLHIDSDNPIDILFSFARETIVHDNNVRRGIWWITNENLDSLANFIDQYTEDTQEDCLRFSDRPHNYLDCQEYVFNLDNGVKLK